MSGVLGACLANRATMSRWDKDTAKWRCCAAARYRFTTGPGRLVKRNKRKAADLTTELRSRARRRGGFIAVGTPQGEGAPRIAAVMNVARDIAKAMTATRSSSTRAGAVGTAEKVSEVVRREPRTRSACQQSEFLKQGRRRDFMKPDRVRDRRQDPRAAEIWSAAPPFTRTGADHVMDCPSADCRVRSTRFSRTRFRS